MRPARLLLSCMLLCACASHPPEPVAGARDLRQRLEQADLALREARLDDAEILYRDLSASHPRLPEVWLQLGNIYARQAQLEAAMRAYKEGLQHHREDARLWHNLALIELRQSIRTLETASRVLPADDPQHARIERLHRSLLQAGRAGHDEAP
jgi:predicted Zn-dependent protease